MRRKRTNVNLRDAVDGLHAIAEEIEAAIDAPPDEISFTTWLRETISTPVMAFRIRSKDLSHTEALELLKLIKDELNNA